MAVQERLQELGLKLPKPSKPVGNYVQAVQTGKLLYLSGKGPWSADGKVPKGKLGREFTVEQGYQFARSVGLMLLGVMQDQLGSLERVLVPTPTGAQVPLAQLADIRIDSGPPVIKSEGARPNSWIYVDTNSSDLGGYVKRAQQAVASQLALPAGYSIAWSGQFAYMQRAAARLKVVIPLTLLVIFLLLYFNFRNLVAPLVVMLAVPFGLIGGFWLVWLLGFNMSVAVAVGFIALAGLAAEIGVLVLTFIDQEIEAMRAEKGVLSATDIMAAVASGTSKRVRPIAMTAAAVIAGLLPILWGSGTGSDVMKRIAAPMVGGMVTTTLLCLLVLPLIYALVLQWRGRRMSRHADDISNP